MPRTTRAAAVADPTRPLLQSGVRRGPDGAVPRYQRVKRYIMGMISSGELRASDRVPSENELVRLVSVSRMTVNRAVKELADEGILQRVAGVGTFVADQRVHAHPLEIRNIKDEIEQRGHVYGARVVALESVPADDELASRCGVPPGSMLYHSVVVHLESGVPLQLDDRHVVPALAPGYLENDFTKVTSYELLMRMAPLHHAEHTVRAVLPEPRVRKLLAMGKDEACLLITRRTWSQGRIASLANLYHAGSRYELGGKAQPIVPPSG